MLLYKDTLWPIEIIIGSAFFYVDLKAAPQILLLFPLILKKSPFA